MKQLKLRPFKVLDRFCESDSFSCASVLRFKDAELMFGLTWAEVGIIYFSGMVAGLISSWLLGTVGVFTIVSSWVSMLALPLIVYAIYLQMRVVKKWCSLCLLVHALLLVNIFIGADYWSDVWQVEVFNFIPIFLSIFLTAALVWLVIKLVSLQDSAMMTHREKTATFRANTSYFDFVLRANPQLVNPRIVPDMQWGSPDAYVRVLAVLSFDCHFCYTVARELMRLRDIFSDDLMLEIVFVPKSTTAFDPLFGEILSKSGSQELLMERWLKTGHSRPNRSGKHESLDTNEIAAVAQERRQWLATNGFTTTPHVFINGYSMGKGLSPMDFIYYLRKKLIYGNEEEKLMYTPRAVYVP